MRDLYSYIIYRNTVIPVTAAFRIALSVIENGRKRKHNWVGPYIEAMYLYLLCGKRVKINDRIRVNFAVYYAI